MSPSSKRITCPSCGGRGTVSHATDDVECSRCAGAGKVKADSPSPLADRQDGPPEA